MVRNILSYIKHGQSWNLKLEISKSVKYLKLKEIRTIEIPGIHTKLRAVKFFPDGTAEL